MWTIRVTTLLLGGLAACASHDVPHSLGANSFDGTIHGQALAIAEAVWAITPTHASGFTGRAASVVMSTETDLCNRIGSNTVRPGEKTVSLAMVDIAGMAMSPPTRPGDYTVPIEAYWAPKTAWLWTSSVDTQCNVSGTGDARVGTVTVETVAGETMIGSFDLDLDLNTSGGVTGAFAPKYCANLENAQSTLPGCQPM